MTQKRFASLTGPLEIKIVAPLALISVATVAGISLALSLIDPSSMGWFVPGIVAIAMLGAIGVTMIVLKRRFFRPLADIELVLERRIAGDRAATITPAGADQIGNLGQAISNVLAMYDADLANSTVFRNAFPDITVRIRRNGTIVDTQINASQHLIADPSRMIGAPLSSHLPAAVVRWFEGIASDLDESGDAAEFEFTASGWVYEARARAGGDDEIMMVIRDVTPRKQQEAQLLSAERYFRGLLERFPGSVIDLDLDGTVHYASRLPFDNSGESGIGNVHFQDIFPESTWPAFERAIEAARDTGRGTEFDVIEDQEDGELCWTTRILPVDGNDAPRRVVVVITDESARHQQRLRLRHRIETLESQHWDYEKRMTDLLIELDNARSAPDVVDQSPPVQSEYAGQTFETLDIGEATSPEPEIHFHLSALIDDVIRACSAGSGGISRVRVTIQPSLPQSLLGNAAALRDTLGELVEQALETSSDDVHVIISQEASRPGTASMQFEIRQATSDGDEQRLRTVTAYLRASDASVASVNGAPERIVRARRAASQLATRIRFDGDAGEEGVYRFSVTFAIDDDAGNGHRWIRGLRTLVIQERGNQINGVQQALSGFGIIGYVVQDEEELLSALEAAEDAQNPYRLILVDAATPGLESVASRLTGQSAPVVLIGTADDHAHAKAIRAGYDGFLSCPVHQSELLEIILSTVEPSSSEPDDIDIETSTIT